MGLGLLVEADVELGDVELGLGVEEEILLVVVVAVRLYCDPGLYCGVGLFCAVGLGGTEDDGKGDERGA